MEKLQCVIERITFHSEENGYSVLKVSARGFNDIIAAVGNMAEPHVGSCFNLYGEWKVDPKWGRQFSFVKSYETLPATANGIKKYLGSGLVKASGPFTPDVLSISSGRIL